MWMIIPLGLTIMMLVSYLWGVRNNGSKNLIDHDNFAVTFFIAFIVFFAWLISIASLACNIGEIAEYQGYYNNVAYPHKISETSTTITVSSQETAIWQAGGITEYNKWLSSYQYWDSIPVIEWYMPELPNLKYVQVK